jgi:imidazolonepropionase-like amidohydrolase
LATHDPARCRTLLAEFARNCTWQDPTLFLNQRGSFRVDTMNSVRVISRFVPPATWQLWEADARAATTTMTPEAQVDLERQGRWYFDLVRAMRDAGVGLLAGTDVSNPYMVPDFSLHEELGMLVRAGLTPLEALQAATLNPALSVAATDSLGTVEPGRVADLVLLDADPLSDIGNVRRIDAVALKGRYFDRPALDAMLAEVERAVAGAGP